MRINRRAFVLPIVLALTFIIFSLSFFLLKVSALQVKIREAMTEKVHLTVDLYSVVNYVNYYLLTGIYDCRSVSFNGNRVFLDGRAQHLTLSFLKNAEVTVKIKDGNTYLLSRALSPNILDSILTGEKKKYFIESLQDWYDKDNIPRPYGAECYFYRSHNFHYCPRNSRAIQNKAELLDVREGKIASEIMKYISDYSENKLNVNTADKKLIKLIFGDLAAFNERKNNCITPETLLGIPLKNRELLTYMPGKYLHISICISSKKLPFVKVCTSYILDRSMEENTSIREFVIY